MTQISRLESPRSRAKTCSDEDNDVKIDENINGENDIDEDIKKTGDSMAKICNDNYNGVKVDVEIDEDIAVDMDNGQLTESI